MSVAKPIEIYSIKVKKRCKLLEDQKLEDIHLHDVDEIIFQSTIRAIALRKWVLLKKEDVDHNLWRPLSKTVSLSSVRQWLHKPLKETVLGIEEFKG
jgi:hypothetical protein